MDETCLLFNTESKKLRNMIEKSMTSSQLTLDDIISVYYQVMSVNSLILVLEGYNNLDDTISSEIHDVKNLIHGTFDKKLHPKMKSQLDFDIEHCKNSLNNISKKTKLEIQDNAKRYETLRELMSTKEFIEQYQKGLNND